MEDKLKTIYEDDDIIVIYREGNGDLLITFSDLVHLSKGQRFFADTPARKMNYPCIGFVAKKPNWYPKNSIIRSLNLINPIISLYDTRIIYGGSMGGYAAIKYSGYLCASIVIALCPQYSIDKKECNGFDPGWNHYFTEDMLGMGIKKEDTSGSIFIFSDHHDKKDFLHSIMIQQICENITLINVANVGHHVTSVFSGTKNLHELINFCKKRDLKNIIKIVNHMKKNSFFWHSTLVKRSIDSHPHLIIPIMKKLFPHDRKYIRFGSELSYKVYRILQNSGNTHAANDYISIFKDGSNKIKDKIIQSSLIKNPDEKITFINTYKKSVFIYDVEKDKLLHCDLPSKLNPLAIFPKFEIIGDYCLFFIEVSSVKIFLGVSSDGYIRSTYDQKTRGIYHYLSIKSLNSGGFSIEYNGNFLCAEGRGNLCFNRTHVKEWETFTFQ